MTWKLPRPKQFAGLAERALFYAMTVAGFAALVRGFWMWWHPAAYLSAGAMLLYAGFLGSVDADSHQDED